MLQRQGEYLGRSSSRSFSRPSEPRQRKHRYSRSRSPVRRSNNPRRRSRSPEPRKPNLRPAAPSTFRNDKLAACPICLGRHRHHIASCQATETWNGKKVSCTRSTSGRILNKRGAALCSDWQRPNRCTDTSGKHIHECSGCGSAEHGADACPSAQT